MLASELYLDSRTQQFYTDAPEIARLMGELLGPVDGKALLEPSVGKGAFLKWLKGKPASIDVVDVDEEALSYVRTNFIESRSFRQDFIRACFYREAEFGCNYDAVISNPPYGLRLSHEFRRDLKSGLGEFYVRESYALFLRFSIERLRAGGRYAFLLPDTFLTSRNHKGLRIFLLQNAPPTEIVLFDSRRFGSVQYGYGGMCIIAGNKSKKISDIRWLDARGNLETKLDVVTSNAQIDQVENLRASLIAGWVPPNVRVRANSARGHELAFYAECRTGIYSGNNERFIGFDRRKIPRRTNGHAIDWKTQVRLTHLTDKEHFEGIQSGPIYVPLVRGGHRKPWEEPTSAIRWDSAAIKHYKTDKKARFQNAQFYFREGLAVPMVTSGRLSASYMKNCVFDQGVVGVFPSDQRLLPLLICYMNAAYVSEVLKKALNPGANNSAGYLKKLPIPDFDDSSMEEAARIFSAAQNDLTQFSDQADDFVRRLFTNQNTSQPRPSPGPLFSKIPSKDPF
jgi:hypothetical protein